MTKSDPETQSAMAYAEAPNKIVRTERGAFAYRELGPHGGVPLRAANTTGHGARQTVSCGACREEESARNCGRCLNR